MLRPSRFCPHTLLLGSYNVNVIGTLNLLLECAELDRPIRFVYASSIAALKPPGVDVANPCGGPVEWMAMSSYGTHKGIGK